MKPQEAIQKLRALFEDLPQEEQPVKMEMLEYALADGSKIKCSAMEVGADVQLEDGTQAPAGEYALADGSSVMVDESGKIAEISSKTEDAIPEEAPAEQMSEEIKNKISELENNFNSVKVENEKLKAELSSMNNKYKEGFKQVLDLVEVMSKVPTSNPAEPQKSFKFESTNDLKYERLNKYRNAILNNKN